MSDTEKLVVDAIITCLIAYSIYKIIQRLSLRFVLRHAGQGEHGKERVLAGGAAVRRLGSMFFSRLLPSVPLYKWRGFVQIFPLKSGGVLEPPPPLEWAGFGRLRGKTREQSVVAACSSRVRHGLKDAGGRRRVRKGACCAAARVYMRHLSSHVTRAFCGCA
jgi:hypothetical protein